MTQLDSTRGRVCARQRGGGKSTERPRVSADETHSHNSERPFFDGEAEEHGTGMRAQKSRVEGV